MSTCANYKLAVGLDYEIGSDSAPRLSVKGRERMADEVVRLAKRFGVPVVERSELANSLASLELEEQIPEELFEPVAILLAQIDTGLTK